jgi:DNA polymerase-4
MTPPRIIAHVDLDAFYASVEIRDNPALQGRPVVVGGSSQRGVVAAASYAARRFGVHSAMPMVRARRLCPELVVVPPRMAHYAAVSADFFEILGRYSPRVEGLSLDEAFLDLSGTERLFGPPDTTIAALRAAVRAELGLACSAGIAPVKFVAKILSDVAKPDGQRQVFAEDLLSFLHPLPVGRLWGVGPRREEELRMLGIQTIGQLARADAKMLERRLGIEAARHLLGLAQGRDTREVEPDRDAKSIGAEETFEEDIINPEAMRLHLLDQCERVMWRLRRSERLADGVTLKYKLADFRSITRQCTIEPTRDAEVILAAARDLLARHPPAGPIRLIGMSVRLFEPGQHTAPPATLFDLLEPAPPKTPTAPGTPADDGRREKLQSALDEIRLKHGTASIVRASLLSLTQRDAAERPAGYVPPDRNTRPKGD